MYNQTLQILADADELRVIDEPLDIELEIAHVAYLEMKKPDGGKALLFTRPISKKLGLNYHSPVLINIFGSTKRCELIFGKDTNDIAEKIQKLLHFTPPKGVINKIRAAFEMFALRSVFPKRGSASSIPCQETIVHKDKVDLMGQLPVLTTWSDDGGPFITMGQVFTTSLDGTKHNVGMYRLQIYDKNRIGLHWQIHKDSNHFFHEYKSAGVKMPVSIAIGGDPLYTWCATAPLPIGMFEIMLYGFVRGKSASLTKCLTNDLFVPHDADFIIEGWVDPEKLEIEGPFGDHTGYYTPREPYPVLEVECLTAKLEPVFYATVVGKPPIEDKYMGFATERIFLPLIKTTCPDLIDYCMPENGVFHNLIIAKLATLYPSHAKQVMHALWGVGQMSFVKHAVFVGTDAPELRDYDSLIRYCLERIDYADIFKSFGILDALDHSSAGYAEGGKLGLDMTNGTINSRRIEALGDGELYTLIASILPETKSVFQHYTDTPNPICIVAIEKSRSLKDTFENLKAVSAHAKIIAIVDSANNDITDGYMILWRVANNIDALRDIYVDGEFIMIDATAKDGRDGYKKEWPKDTLCDIKVLQSLKEKGIVDFDEAHLKRFGITEF
jgi:4-hydroxy-3-polyprenylbenzoate decarboxylase